MPNDKPYTTPVWCMGFVILAKIFFAWFTVFALQRVNRVDGMDDYFRRLYIDQLISNGIVVVILLAEAVTYWKIRNRKIRKDFVWWHVGALILAFFVLPILIMSLNVWLTYNYPTGDQSRLYSINRIRVLIFWSLIVIAHIFFVLVLISAYKKRLDPNPPVPNNPDILNDYA